MITIDESKMYRVLERYYPKVSYTRMFEIGEKIRKTGTISRTGSISIDEIDLKNIFYGYYPKISHKMAGRIIRDLEIIQIGEN